MSEVKIITAFTPASKEPHITAEDDAAIYEGIVGSDGVLNIGEKLRYEIVSNNKIKIYDGVFEIGGHFARIPQGGFVEVTITNGGSGKRNDIIVAKLAKDSVSGDKATIEVKKGSEAPSSPKDPAIIKDDIYSGGRVREFPLYRVRLNGITIEKVEPMFDIDFTSLKGMSKLKEEKLTKLTLDSKVKNTGVNRLGQIKFEGEANYRNINYTMMAIKDPKLNSSYFIPNTSHIRPAFYFAWMQKNSGHVSYMLPYRSNAVESIDETRITYRNPQETNWDGYTLYILIAYYD